MHFEAVGLKGWIKNWLTDPGVVLFLLLCLEYGISDIIYYFTGWYAVNTKRNIESAYADGANSQTYFHIVIPNIKGWYRYAWSFYLTGAIKTFDIPYLMTQGGPERKHISIYLYV